MRDTRTIPPSPIQVKMTRGTDSEKGKPPSLGARLRRRDNIKGVDDEIMFSFVWAKEKMKEEEQRTSAQCKRARI